MKNIVKFFLLSGISLGIYSACNKRISDITAGIPALSPVSEDMNAGSWKTILLSRPDSFAVAVPAAVNTPAYQGELNEIKGYQQQLTQAQQQAITYWAAGGVLRWNEIMRDLVAKYNLPPYQNANGSYPIPSASNPFAYPLFPFSNPPYAARAYAYVSAAQYDALVACWYFKQLYKRPAPYKVDSTIKTQVSKTSMPSYPSEAAVLAGVSAEMMKLFFPGEIASMQQKLEEQEQATIMSGAATRSDIVAGEALGRQVAELFIAKGKGDRAGGAVGNPVIWATLDTTAMNLGEIPWYSQDAPKRPPMLPLFGKVKSLLIDSADIIALRPGPPPSTGSPEMAQQTQEVYEYTKNATSEHIRIIELWADGAGTYTPPGHWNAIAAGDFIKAQYSEVRWARNMALLNMTLMDAAIVCWETKYYYFNPRPSQMNPAIKTLTGIPNFPSYISGHSTFTGAAATILGHILPANAAVYMQMAQEASISRVVGGLHYPIDCSVGMQVGMNVGNFAVKRALIDGAE